MPIFPMSWKSAPSSSRFSDAPSSPSSSADLQRQVRDPAGVRGRVLVVRLERVRERLDRLEERPLEVVEAPGVRQCELGLVRDSREQAKLSLVEGAVRRSADRNAAETAAVQRQRRDARLAVRPVDDERSRTASRWLAAREGAHPAGQPLAVEVASRGQPLESHVRATSPPTASWNQKRRARRSERACRELDDAVDDRRPYPPRRELAAELQQRGRATRPRVARPRRGRVLERDGGMTGEHLEQADVVLVELVETELGDDDHADDARAVTSAGRRPATRR